MEGSNRDLTAVATISTFGCSSSGNPPTLTAIKVPMWSVPRALYCNICETFHEHLIESDGTAQCQIAASIIHTIIARRHDSYTWNGNCKGGLKVQVELVSVIYAFQWPLLVSIGLVINVHFSLARYRL